MPLAQSWQTAAPSRSENLPAPQDTHLAPPSCSDIFPATQSEQPARAEVLLTLPIGHAWHKVIAVATAKGKAFGVLMPDKLPNYPEPVSM